MNNYSNDLRVVDLDSKITLKITKNLFKKIDITCKTIPFLEWSGVVFYNIVKGSIKDPSKMVIEAKDLLLMNKGSQAHTSFKFNAKVTDYIMKMNYLDDGTRWGLIHSHNTMPTFFSTEDNSELSDNVDNYAIYLSLIVNNDNQYTAKVARKADVKYSKVIIDTVDENAEKLVLKNFDDSLNKIESVVLANSCDIIMPEVEVYDDFYNQLWEINKSERYVNVASKSNYNAKGNSKPWYNSKNKKNKLKGYNNASKIDIPLYLAYHLETSFSYLHYYLQNTTVYDENVHGVEDFEAKVIEYNPGIDDSTLYSIITDAIDYLEPYKDSFFGGKLYESFMGKLISLTQDLTPQIYDDLQKTFSEQHNFGQW